MEYEIIVRRRKDNPEHREIRNQMPYNERYGEGQYLYLDILQTVITEKQFDAVRKSLLTVF